MLKHGLIQDAHYWKVLSDYKSISTAHISMHIFHSVGIKNEVVKKDPRENGLRKILNFGHTLGHAIESYCLSSEHHSSLLHGEAIAIGMIMEAFLSAELLGLPMDECGEIKSIFDSIYPKVAFKETRYKGHFRALDLR